MAIAIGPSLDPDDVAPFAQRHLRERGERDGLGGVRALQKPSDQLDVEDP